MTYVIEERNGRVEVDGATSDEVREGLDLLAAARTLQYQHSSSARTGLEHVMGLAKLDLIPPASLEQARQLTQLKLELLSTPAFSYESLAEVRSDRRVPTTRTWVSRQRKKQAIVVVAVDGKVVIPAFQFTAEGDLRRELEPILGTLLSAGVDSWDLWVWLTRSTPLLSGGVPHELARDQGQRVLRAAQRFAARR